MLQALQAWQASGRDGATSPTTQRNPSPAIGRRDSPPWAQAYERDEASAAAGAGVIVLGVCALDKKALCPAMQQLLQRLPRNLFEVVLFGNETIHKQPVQSWPLCDVLLAFFSTGFPLEKAIAYAQLRRPVLLNDLQQQQVMRDRQLIYEELARAGVPTPRYAVVKRDAHGATSSALQETEDAIVIDGMKLEKPFVEKPLDADNHNVHVYFPSRVGGGSKRLFRKVRRERCTIDCT